MARNKTENAQYMKEWHLKKRNEIYAFKEKNPCVDCNQYFPHYVMDFDHVRGEKLFNVSSAISKRINKKTIWDEIAKCDLICANCHRVRTYMEKSTYGKN